MAIRGDVAPEDGLPVLSNRAANEIKRLTEERDEALERYEAARTRAQHYADKLRQMTGKFQRSEAKRSATLDAHAETADLLAEWPPAMSGLQTVFAECIDIFLTGFKGSDSVETMRERMLAHADERFDALNDLEARTDANLYPDDIDKPECASCGEQATQSCDKNVTLCDECVDKLIKNAIKVASESIGWIESVPNYCGEFGLKDLGKPWPLRWSKCDYRNLARLADREEE